MQLPLALRADEGGQEATQTLDEHVPLTQLVPAAHGPALFLSKQVPLEETKPLFGSVHLQVLVAASQVAPLPTGQEQVLAPAVVDVEPPPQATQGVLPSKLIV